MSILPTVSLSTLERAVQRVAAAVRHAGHDALLPKTPGVPASDDAMPHSPMTPTVILSAPILSQRMGGESLKALQIHIELVRAGVDVIQITHARVRDELREQFPHLRIEYIEDSAWQRLFFRSFVLRPIVRMSFQKMAARRAERLLASLPNAVVHVPTPISPVQPHATVRNAPVVLGPLNGNAQYPRAFRHREDFVRRLRRVGHRPLQFLHRLFFPANREADLVLVSGGERSFESLRLAGCRDERLVASVDSGIDEKFCTAPRITHVGRNVRFVHSGRLVDDKGADLAIRALAAMRARDATLDLIGRGPARERFAALAAELGVADRVRFVEWVDHAQIADALRPYRAFVFPSLAEANGIVVQEALALGLPVVCVDWAGPALLVTPECGVKIEPRSEAYVVEQVARAMDALGEDAALAERMSIAARQRAIDEGYAWPEIIRRWIAMYRELAAAQRR